ncbi:rod shape-determining protein MreD [Crocinitomicaceae bacterium]|nr:rod shape-determining protein MreD [Crocinitomicaceae bacterium]
MRSIYIFIFRFLLFVFLQVFIFNQLEITTYVHIMVSPLYIMLLPFDLSVIRLLFISFFLGLCIDALSNTFGLHASALVFTAYLRPFVFRWFAPRDGYDSIKNPSIFDMGNKWFFFAFGSLIILHHFWFFTLESFSISEILLILKKTVPSALLSFIVCIILQTLILKKSK